MNLTFSETATSISIKKRVTSAVLSVLVLVSWCAAQTIPPAEVAQIEDPENYAAPILWQRYAVVPANVSFSLPKDPIVMESTDTCWGEVRYYAYANETIYEFRVRTLATEGAMVSEICGRGATELQAIMDRRVGELRLTKPISETDSAIGLRKAKLFRWETTNEFAARWIVSDLSNNRWFELSINRRKDVPVDEERFLASLEFKRNGTDIKSGAQRTPGDPGFKIDTEATDGGSRPTTAPLGVVGKPVPKYPLPEGKAGLRGMVTLSIAFLANGAIGDIKVVSATPGFAEEAIAAARRIVFLPQRKNGVPVSTVKRVEYVFGLP